MATAPQPVSFEEYMSTSYTPDCEYVNGVVVERHVGKTKHSYTQFEIGVALREVLRPRGFIVLTEQRTGVGPYRVRIPDVSVVKRLEPEVTTEAPVLCVEVFSPDDRWRNVNAVIADYQEMGVPCVWVVDPWLRRAWIFELDEAPAEVRDGWLVAPHLEIKVELERVLSPEDVE